MEHSHLEKLYLHDRVAFSRPGEFVLKEDSQVLVQRFSCPWEKSGGSAL